MAFREAFRALASHGFGRFSVLASYGIAGAFAAYAISLRAGSAAPNTLLLPARAAEAAIWLAVVPLLLHAVAVDPKAQAPRAAALGLGAAGLSARQLRQAARRALLLRVFAATALPVAISGVVSLVVAPSITAALQRLLLLVVVLSYAAMVALLWGTLGTLVKRAAPVRGRSALLGVMFGSAVLADVANSPWLSLLGMSEQLLEVLLAVGGWGRG